MKSPYSDPYLSLRARGLYALYVETGRVLSAEEISSAVPEGRDAIRSAMKELKDFGYIKAVKHQINGQWRTLLKFTDDGLSGVGKSGVLSSLLNTNDISTSLEVLEVLRTSNTSTASKKEGVDMGWPNLDENLPKPKRNQIDEDDSGAVGKIIDKKALRNLKYKKTKFESTSQSMQRTERPEELWNANDLVSEFYDLSREHLPGVPGQVNGQSLAKWVNKTISAGATNLSILKAIRIFFADPRLLRDAGIGQPIWRRFIAFYPTIHGIAVQVAEPEFVDEDFLAHQEKMLKLLEG